MSEVVLEPGAQEIADATANPPYLYELGVEKARQVFDDLQSEPIEKAEVGEDKWITVPAEVGDVPVRIIKPVGASGTLPVILYVHGGGWILGNSGTHDRLIRELCAGANAALVFPEYDRSPEAQFPHAIEQAYATARWITQQGADEGLDGSRMAIAGDSVGGNMTIALTMLAKQRGDVTFAHQSLYYPVTEGAQNTESYKTFANGPFLTAKAMAWFWDAYLPDVERRSDVLASPLNASLDDLRGLPPALVIVDQNDPLRDEGEAYSAKLVQAGVETASIRINHVTHDFMLLNKERPTQGTTAAVELAIITLRKALGTKAP